jgi:hypothetical protein
LKFKHLIKKDNYEKNVFYFILVLGMISCSSSDDKNTQEDYEFISEYSATITVGGIVGIEKRTFKKGETYKGTDK